MNSTHVIAVVLREEVKPLLEEDDELVGHLLKLVNVVVGIDGAEARADGVVNEQKIGELVPGAIVVHQMVLILQAIRTDFHHGAIFGTATWSTIDPNDGSLFIGDVLILEMPEE